MIYTDARGRNTAMKESVFVVVTSPAMTAEDLEGCVQDGAGFPDGLTITVTELDASRMARYEKALQRIENLDNVPEATAIAKEALRTAA